MASVCWVGYVPAATGPGVDVAKSADGSLFQCSDLAIDPAGDSAETVACMADDVFCLLAYVAAVVLHHQQIQKRCVVTLLRWLTFSVISLTDRRGALCRWLDHNGGPQP